MSYANLIRQVSGWTANDLGNLIDGVGGAQSTLNWTSWTPTLTATGSMTITTQVIERCKFIQIGKLFKVKVGFTYTLGGTASNAIILPLPAGITTHASGRQASPILVKAAVDWEPGMIFTAGNQTTVDIYRTPTINFVLGANMQFFGEIDLEIA